MAKGDKAKAILWLYDMKSYGKKRQRQVATKFQAGEANAHDVQKVAKAQKVIDQLLQLLNDCPMELDELHEMCKGIKVDKRQIKMITKNPI